MRLSVLPGLVCLFPLPGQGSFWSLFLEIGSHTLAHSLILLVFPCWGCYYTLCCPKGFLNSPNLIFFSCSAWVFLLPCLPNCWFDLLFHLTWCLFLPLYYLFQILHSLFLTVPFLWFLCLFLNAVGYLYNHYSKLSI